MINRVHTSGWSPFVGAGFLVLALLTLGWTVWRFTAVAQVPDSTTRPAPSAVGLPAAPPQEPELIVAAVNVDPFHPDRRRPTQRFRLPSERTVSVPPRQTAPTPAPRTVDIILTGTLVSPGRGGSALIQRNGSNSIVRVGERVADLTLMEVTTTSATFSGTDGSRVVIRVSRTGGEL